MRKRPLPGRVLAVMAVAVAAVGAGLLYASEPVGATGHTAVRSLSTAEVAAGGEVEVTIEVSDFWPFGRVTETLPGGWTYTGVEGLSDAAVSVEGREVRFLLLPDVGAFTYTVTAPYSVGTHTFSGIFEDSNRLAEAVGGDNEIAVVPPWVVARSLSTGRVVPGGEVEVSIEVEGIWSIGTVTETLPDGWAYSGVEGLADAAVSVEGRTARFLLPVDVGAFSYTVTAPDAVGAYAFSGVFEDSNGAADAVGGDNEIAVEVPSWVAVRSLSTAQVVPGGEVEVTVEASGFGPFGWVTETLPDGWANAGVEGRTIRFLLLSDSGAITYTVTAPDAVGAYAFSGEFEDSSALVGPVGGDDEVAVVVPAWVVVRSFGTGQVVSGGEVEVTIEAEGFWSLGQVAETLPEGWAYTGVEGLSDGAVAVEGRTIKFSLPSDVGAFTYTVTAPNAVGAHTFSGVFVDTYREAVAVGGDNEIAVVLGDDETAEDEDVEMSEDGNDESVEGPPPWIYDAIVERDRLIAVQASLLNSYRCEFNVDTEIVPGGCAEGKPARQPAEPAPFMGTPSEAEVEIRDELIAAQEELLNAYRCLFNIDTHLVPGRCTA